MIFIVLDDMIGITPTNYLLYRLRSLSFDLDFFIQLALVLGGLFATITPGYYAGRWVYRIIPKLPTAAAWVILYAVTIFSSLSLGLVIAVPLLFYLRLY